ncbi:hypothetical protein quinque_011345 [Culex quinquefasciatus]
MNLLQVLFLALVQQLGSIRGDDTRVWGPGLELADKLPLNARYFFVESRDGAGRIVPQQYRVLFKGHSRIGSCRVKIEQIDRVDGSSIIRYKLMETCWNVEIHVLLGERHLGQSPYRFEGKLYTENCYCPQAPLEDWMEQIGCPICDRGSFSSMTNRVRFRYAIMWSRTTKSIGPATVGTPVFKMYMDAILLSLARKTLLPDMELFVNLGDWPLVTKGGHRRTTGPYPIFSWCGSEDTFDIVMPTYDLVEASLEAMSRVSLDMLSVQRKGVPWEEKVPKAFWRGRDACRERLDLVGLSQQHPDLVNASLTNFFFFRDEEKKYGPKVAHISFFDFFDYKYQVNVDGTVAAYRFPYLLGGSSVVFKQASKYYEHFYSKLEQGREYLPLKRDLSDLVENIQRARQQDDEMITVRDNAKAFVDQHLLPRSILCYSGLLFKEYSQNIVSPVQILPGMEQASQPGTSSNCECDSVEGNNHDEL